MNLNFNVDYFEVSEKDNSPMINIESVIDNNQNDSFFLCKYLWNV